jgi:hypothetical protein
MCGGLLPPLGHFVLCSANHAVTVHTSFCYNFSNKSTNKYYRGELQPFVSRPALLSKRNTTLWGFYLVKTRKATTFFSNTKINMAVFEGLTSQTIP